MPDTKQIPQPTVSVVIPVFNCEAYIWEAVESVLAQTYPSVDIIVIDDGSNDGSAKVLAGFGDSITYHFQENRGLGAARNSGLDMAQGEYIAFIDSDDRWLPDKIELQMSYMLEHSETDIIFTHIRQFFSPDIASSLRRKLQIPVVELPGLFATTCLATSECFRRAGQFATDLRVGEFIDWYTRALDSGLKSHLMDDVLAERRIHNDNMGTREKDSRADYLKVLRMSLQRKRKMEEGI